ncbi:hypothetical protein WR25_21270 [Diploscapter pachys]|uniref:GPI transamidase subunit PIG-U n=1 Tax=Diploscapter pachys TaxID=2018661 RepID=A0A2A2JDF1_9BILA|nr:hypothetical protein WR25_21270 [Diploscapter pachys]
MTNSGGGGSRSDKRKGAGEVRKRKSCTLDTEVADVAQTDEIQSKRVKNDEDDVLKVRTRHKKSNSLVITVLGGTILRILCYLFIYDYLAKQPQLSTPFVSFQRLQSGVAMLKDGVSPYDGDTILIQPVVLHVFSLIWSAPRWVLLTAYIFLDLLAAASIRDAVQAIFKELNYKDPDDYAAMAFKFYFLNPLTICTSAILSLATIYNSLLTLFVYAFCKSALVTASALLGVIAYFSLYPIVLVISLWIRLRTFKKISASFGILALTLAGLFYVNYALNGFSTSFVKNCYGMLLSLDDLTPNVGVYWYFFAQIFNPMRVFYLFVFQLILPTMCLVLAFTLRLL